jgi:L-ascorbate metabolism protein UlaG (beta-lactamase superfamily)
MHITWLGHSCFKLQDKTTNDGVTVITDPYDGKIGLRAPSHEADILTISHDHYDHNNRDVIRGNPYIIDTAGEYDIKGVAITGIEAYHHDTQGKERGKNIIYRIEIDGVVVTHLGDLGTTLDEKQLEGIAGTDILLIPVGGKYTLDAKKAVEVISQVEPKIVIPMHYKVADLKIEGLDGVDKFIKELGIEPRRESKFKTTKKDLPQEGVELVILEM